MNKPYQIKVHLLFVHRSLCKVYHNVITLDPGNIFDIVYDYGNG